MPNPALHFLLACIAALLAGCEIDRPLIVPGDAYEPRLAMDRESLARFDTVEIRLVDPDDPSVSILLWKGPPGATDTLPPHLAGDGQTLVYLVQGYRINLGHCFTGRITRRGVVDTVLIDSCTVEPRIPDPKPGVPTTFQNAALVIENPGKSDTALLVFLANVPDSGNTTFTLTGSEPWIQPIPDEFPAKGNRIIQVRLNRSTLAPGAYRGKLMLHARGKVLDTLTIDFTVPKPVADIRGTVVDWRDSRPQSGLTIVLDGTPVKSVQSDSDGSFSFTGVDLDRHVLEVSGPGRVGRIDTFNIAAEGPFLRTVTVAPAREFMAVNIGWLSDLGRTAVADGHGLVLSVGVGQAGNVAVFPLDNPSSSLQRIFPQGNTDGDPDFPEIYESGEVTADSQAIFIAYPGDSRLGRIGNWRTAPETLSVAVPMEPGALLLHGSSLFALGRAADSALVLGEWSAADLSPIRIDSLPGFRWDGVIPELFSPQMAVWDGSIYAVDGNGPGVKGNVLRIGLESRKVLDSRQTTDAVLTGLAIHDGMIFVTSRSSTAEAIRIFDPELSETGRIGVGPGAGRIAFAAEGSMRGYGFVATESHAILVIHPLAKQPLGKLSYPGSRPARSLSVDGRSGTVLVSDGDKLYSIRF